MMIPETASRTAKPIVLVLGATGRLGSAAVRAFVAAGWSVVAHARRVPASLPVGATCVTTPLADVASVTAAAAGARAVIYAINQPYELWASQALVQATQGMDIAQRLGALFMFPGNVYNFGAHMPALLRADTPPAPTTEKGRIRVAIEHEMHARSALGLRSVVLRAGDFFGAGSGSWFDSVIVKSLPKRKLVYAGPLDRVHAWAYVPDLARAFVAVAGRAQHLPAFACLPFPGYTLTGAELLDAIERAAARLGLRGPKVLLRSSLPWGFIRAMKWLVPSWRGIVDLAYLFEVPHALDGQALSHAVGAFNITPIDVALRATLIDLGMAPAAGSSRAEHSAPDGA